jgi:hypothetical protein
VYKVEKNVVATVGGSTVTENNWYASVTDAIAAAQDGETIYLQKDLADIGTVTISKSITFNGNGHIIAARRLCLPPQPVISPLPT